MLNDPIADMLTRIRNATRALHETTTQPTSRTKVEIARVLKDEGYIKDYRVVTGEAFDTLVVELTSGRSRERVITDLRRISKPGRLSLVGTMLQDTTAPELLTRYRAQVVAPRRRRIGPAFAPAPDRAAHWLR